MTDAMIPPTINLNGTSRKALIAEVITALEAVRAAETAINALTIHGRDFPGREDDLQQAWPVRRAMSRTLSEMVETLTDYGLAINDSNIALQMKARNEG